MDENELNDRLASMRADMDQAREGLKELAGLVADYYKDLVVTQCLPPEVAAALTLGLQAGILSASGEQE